MASQIDQRTTDFEGVKKILAQYQRIRLVHTEGEPPDCYEIEYHVTGLVREADGSIRKVSRHIVLITLPFGYPHFPPAVKPLTPAFHPDIDPDAVRISSRWQQEPSLAKLIPHIGEMLCGKAYSLEDPFNQEAADWYAAHAAELPVDTLEGETSVAADADEFDLGLEDIDLTQTVSYEEQEGGLSLDLEPPQAVQDIAALAAAQPVHHALELETKEDAAQGEEDFDLGLDDSSTAAHDDLDLGLEIGEPEDAAPQQKDFSSKLSEIRAHVDRREMTIAARLLAELPASLPEAEPLRKKVKAAQAQCDQLLQEMKMLEDEDNFPEAGKVFEQLKKVAVDTPGLAEIGRRLQQSQSMLDTFSLKEEKAEPQVDSPPENEKKKKAAPPPPKPKTEKKEKPVAEPPKEKREVSTAKAKISRSVLRREIPVAPFAAAAVIAAVIIAGGLVYTRDSNVLMEAGLDWQEAQALIKQKKYQEGEAKANSASSRLKTIFTPLSEKSRMKTEIAALLETEEFKQGKAGKRTYKEQELPLEEANKREQLDKMAAQAEALKQSSLSEAAELYAKAAELAASPVSLPAEAKRLKETARQLWLKEASANAEKAEQAGDWENAAKLYQKASQFCAPDECELVSSKLTNAAFYWEIDQAKKNFKNARSRSQELLDQLNRAKELLEKNPATATLEKRQELESLMARSQFYQRLSQAGEAYSQGEYAIAVSGYRQALTLLKDKQQLFEEPERSAESKISRTAAMIEISVELNAAAEAEQRNDLVAALRHYKEVQNLLNSLGLTKDESLMALSRDVSGKVSSLSSTAGMKRKMDWLERNYKRIFIAAYPATRVSDLSSPSLSLIKKIGNQELYKLTCRERSYYQLELPYLYDPVADQWTPSRNDQ
jgi:ubiquitin-protein ligase